MWSKMTSTMLMVVDGGTPGMIMTVTSMLPCAPCGRSPTSHSTHSPPAPTRLGGGVELMNGASGGKSLRILTLFS